MATLETASKRVTKCEWWKHLRPALKRASAKGIRRRDRGLIAEWDEEIEELAFERSWRNFDDYDDYDDPDDWDVGCEGNDCAYCSGELPRDGAPLWERVAILKENGMHRV